MRNKTFIQVIFLIVFLATIFYMVYPKYVFKDKKNTYSVVILNTITGNVIEKKQR